MSGLSRPWEIVTRKGSGPLMHFDGRKFTNDDHTPSKPYTFAEGSSQARKLLQRYEILQSKGYHVWLRKIDWSKRPRKNPDFNGSTAGLEQAAHKFEDFTGFEADKVTKVNYTAPKEGLVIGDLDVIGYRVKRVGVDGGKTVRYGHRFKKASRPLLAVSKDGTQLLIVGGQYEFTEAGIEDR